MVLLLFFFFFQAEDGIRDHCVTGVQTCALPISKSISQSSPTFCRWMRACRRDTLGESRTIVFAAVRPTEQLPRIGWHVPSAASNQAPSSGGAFTRKEAIKSNTGCKASEMY